MDKKKLHINCALCDATEAGEEIFNSYEEVSINAAVVFLNDESEELIHRYGVSLNAADIEKAPKGVKITVKNGEYRITASDEPKDKTVLVVNGRLVIEKGAERAMEGYASIVVNGTAVCPESMAKYTAGLSVNGTTDIYPDDAALLKSSFNVDKVFLLRASGKYYARSKVVILDTDLDYSGLSGKNVSFKTRRAIIAEPLLETVLPLFDRETEVTVVPEGCKYLSDDTELTGGLIKKHGGRLYIDGDLNVRAKDAEALKNVEYLHVNGTVLAPRSAEDILNGMDMEYKDLRLVHDKHITDRPTAHIDRAMLEEGDGVTVMDCAVVKLAEDISRELIKEKLEMIDCAVVECTEEQKSAVELIAQDVAAIGKKENGPLSGILGGKDTKVINAATYKL